MPLNQKEQKFFQFIEQEAKKKTASIEPVTAFTLRENAKAFQEFIGDECDIPKVERMIPMRDGYEIPVRIYNAHLKLSPVMIFYPGCGYLIDTIYEANARAASRVAKLINIKVIVIQARLVPEVTLEKAITDGYDAAKFIYQHAQEFGIDKRQFFIGGLSSGANCAATVSRLSRDDIDFKIKRQILISGNFDLTRSSRSNIKYQKFSDYEDEDKILPQSMIKIQTDLYGLTTEQMQSSFYSPLFATYTSDYVPTTLIVA